MVICYSGLRKPLPPNPSMDLAHLELHANSWLWPLIPQQVTPTCPWPPYSSFSPLLLAPDIRISLWSDKHPPLGLCLCCSTCLQLFPASAPSNLSLQIRPSLHHVPFWLYFSLHPLSQCHTHTHTHLFSVYLSRMSAPHGQGFFSHSPHAPGTRNRNRHMRGA